MPRTKKTHSGGAERMCYCVQCKAKVPIHDAKVIETANHRYRLTGIDQYGHHTSQFISRNAAHGSGLIGQLLGMPGGKIPILSDLPMIGSIF